MYLSEQQRLCLRHIGIDRWQVKKNIHQSIEDMQSYFCDGEVCAAPVLLVFSESDQVALSSMNGFIDDLICYLKQPSYCIAFLGSSTRAEVSYTFQQLFTVVQPRYIINFASGGIVLEHDEHLSCYIETLPLQALLADSLKKQQVLDDVQSSALP